MSVKQRVRLIPLALVVLSLLCSIFLPRAGWYLAGHSLALVAALAVPASFWWFSRGAAAPNKTLRVALLAGLCAPAAVLACAEAIMLSYGSVEGAAADIGGTFLWLVGGLGLLSLSGLAAFLWPHKER